MFNYYRRRRTYRRSLFSFSFTRCCTAVIGGVVTIIIAMFLAGAISAQDLMNLIIWLVVIGVILGVLYLVLKYGRKKKSSSSSSKSKSSSRSSTSRKRTTSRSRRATTRDRDDYDVDERDRYASRSRSSTSDEEDDDSDRRRYSSTPKTSNGWTPREDVEEGESSSKSKKSESKGSFFDGVKTEETKQGETVEDPSPGEKYCPECGNKSPDNAKFCTECGHQF